MPYTAATMASILANANKNTSQFFYIIGDDITDVKKNKRLQY